MKNLSNILVVLGSSLGRAQAFESGVALAKASGAVLHLRLFDFDEAVAATGELVSPETMALARAQHLRLRREWLAAQSDVLVRKGLRVTSDTIWAPRLVDSILSAVAQTGSDLVIKDRHNDTSLDRLAHGSADLALLRSCPVPVLLVQPSINALPAKMAVAIDAPVGSCEIDPFNQQLVTAAKTMAELYGATLHTLRVEAHVAPLDQEWQRSRPEHDAVSLFLDIHHIEHQHQYILHGHADSEISNFVRHADIDLLILGSCKRTGVERFMLGSTSESVVKHAPCAILVIKPDGFVAPASTSPPPGTQSDADDAISRYHRPYTGTQHEEHAL